MYTQIYDSQVYQVPIDDVQCTYQSKNYWLIQKIFLYFLCMRCDVFTFTSNISTCPIATIISHIPIQTVCAALGICGSLTMDAYVSCLQPDLRRPLINLRWYYNICKTAWKQNQCPATIPTQACGWFVAEILMLTRCSHTYIYIGIASMLSFLLRTPLCVCWSSWIFVVVVRSLWWWWWCCCCTACARTRSNFADRFWNSVCIICCQTRLVAHKIHIRKVYKAYAHVVVI